MKRKRFRCTPHTNLLSIGKQWTKLLLSFGFNRFQPRPTHFIWIFIFALSAVDHHIDRPACAGSIIAQSGNQFLWPMALVLPFLNPSNWPWATACARLHFVSVLWQQKRVSEERFDVSLLSKWSVTNQWISYYRHRSELNASASFGEKINISFLNFTLDKGKRTIFSPLAPSRCTRVENGSALEMGEKMFKLIFYLVSVPGDEYHLKCAVSHGK